MLSSNLYSLATAVKSWLVARKPRPTSTYAIPRETASAAANFFADAAREWIRM